MRAKGEHDRSRAVERDDGKQVLTDLPVYRLPVLWGPGIEQITEIFPVPNNDPEVACGRFRRNYADIACEFVRRSVAVRLAGGPAVAEDAMGVDNRFAPRAVVLDLNRQRVIR